MTQQVRGKEATGSGFDEGISSDKANVSETKGVADPARSKYYTQKASFYSWLRFIVPISLVLIPSIVGFYLLQLWGPLIRLEEGFKNLSDKVTNNSSAIELLEDNVRQEDPLNRQIGPNQNGKY